MSRPRLLVLNQYYRPGVEATANLLADLCEDLAADCEVTVVTVGLRIARTSRTKKLNGVRVIRDIRRRSTGHSFTAARINYMTTSPDISSRALIRNGPDLVLCMTDPPIVGDLGVLVARRYRVPLLVISEDVFPEIATEFGRLTNPIAPRDAPEAGRLLPRAR